MGELSEQQPQLMQAAIQQLPADKLRFVAGLVSAEGHAAGSCGSHTASACCLHRQLLHGMVVVMLSSMVQSSAYMTAHHSISVRMVPIASFTHAHVGLQASPEEVLEAVAQGVD